LTQTITAGIAKTTEHGKRPAPAGRFSVFPLLIESGKRESEVLRVLKRKILEAILLAISIAVAIIAKGDEEDRQ
jgi:hypothetical protein